MKILPVISNVEAPAPGSGAIPSSTSNYFACDADGDVFEKMVSLIRTPSVEELVGRNNIVLNLWERTQRIETFDDPEISGLAASGPELDSEHELIVAYEVYIESNENDLRPTAEKSIVETKSDTLPLRQNYPKWNLDPQTADVLDHIKWQGKASRMPITNSIDNASLGLMFWNDLENFWIQIPDRHLDSTGLTKMRKKSLDSPFVISKTETAAIERDPKEYFDVPSLEANKFLPKSSAEFDISYAEHAMVTSQRPKHSIIENLQYQTTKKPEDRNPEHFQEASPKVITQQGFSQEAVSLEPVRLATHGATPTKGAVVAKTEERNGPDNFPTPRASEEKFCQSLKELVDSGESMQRPLKDKVMVMDAEYNKVISPMSKVTSGEINFKPEPWIVDSNPRQRSQFDDLPLRDDDATRRVLPSAGSFSAEPPIDEIEKRIIGGSLQRHSTNSVELSSGYDSFLRVDVSPTIVSDRSDTARLTAPILDSIKAFVQRLPDVPRDHLVSAIVEDALTLRVLSNTDTVDIRFVSDSRDSLDLLVRHQTQLEGELRRFGVESFALSFGLKGEDRRSQRSFADVQEETEVAASSVTDIPKTGGFATPIGVDRRI